jgi:hypothetical protein
MAGGSRTEWDHGHSSRNTQAARNRFNDGDDMKLDRPRLDRATWLARRATSSRHPKRGQHKVLHVSTNFAWIDIDQLRKEPTGIVDERFLKVGKGNTRRGSFKE